MTALARPSIYDDPDTAEFLCARNVDAAVQALIAALKDGVGNSGRFHAQYAEALETFQNVVHDEFPTLAFVEDQIRWSA